MRLIRLEFWRRFIEQNNNNSHKCCRYCVYIQLYVLSTKSLVSVSFDHRSVYRRLFVSDLFRTKTSFSSSTSVTVLLRVLFDRFRDAFTGNTTFDIYIKTNKDRSLHNSNAPAIHAETFPNLFDTLRTALGKSSIYRDSYFSRTYYVAIQWYHMFWTTCYSTFGYTTSILYFFFFFMGARFQWLRGNWLYF